MDKKWARLAALATTAGLAACAAGDGTEREGNGGAVADVSEIGSAESMQSRLAKFAPVTLTFDEALLDENRRTVVKNLVEASDELDRIFEHQAWRGNADPASWLPAGDDPESRAAREYVHIMVGPWDQLDDGRPFIDGVGPRPAGAGSYPEDLTAEEFEAFVAQYPEVADKLTSYYTVVGRYGDALVATPYREAYRDRLTAAAENLRTAAAAAENPSLASFLEKRAEALLSDEYYESEVAWMRLADNLIDPTIGPYEVYEDGLFGYKASYESYIGLRDPAESGRLESLVAYLPSLEANLPIPDEHKYLDRPFTSPISVVTLIYAAGEARKGTQTIAFNLPNDPRVREEEGSKKVMLRNVIDAKFEQILKPIADMVLDENQAARLTVDPYFTRVLMHELAHGLGPDYVTGQPDVTVNKALRDLYSALEEAKADAVGTHSLGVLAEQGVYTAEFQEEVYIDHVADMFRCVRFGAEEAHGKGCLVQFNYLWENGAITHDDETSRFRTVLEKMPGAISDLSGQLLLLQATGDYAGAEAFLERYGTMTPEMLGALERLDGVVPVDIRPTYAVKEMMQTW
jgi:Peptidase family M49